MKIVDTKSETADVPFRVRVNRTGRRTYSREYKREIIEECRAPGASVSAIALAHRINANVVRKWLVRHEAGSLGRRRRKATPMLLPVTIEGRSGCVPLAQPISPPTECAPSTIEIEFHRARVCVRGVVDVSALRTVLEVLGQR